MLRKSTIWALAFALLLPLSASAQSRGPIRGPVRVKAVDKRLTSARTQARVKPVAKPRISLGGKGMPKGYRLQEVTHKGKQFYRTWRVTSEAGFKRITDKSNGFRWFQGDGQYGEAFYLFRTKGAAKTFLKAEKTRDGGKRSVLAEVLLPKDKFDAVKKSQVSTASDWGMQRGRNAPSYGTLRDLRNASHIVFGRWAPSPFVAEPAYDKLNGAKQFAVVQRGQPSILNEAVILLHKGKTAASAK